MPLTYPLDRDTFLGALRIGASTIQLYEPMTSSSRADGLFQRASQGEAVWQGRIDLAQAPHAQSIAAEALLSALVRPARRFLAYDPRRFGPASDPAGTTLGAAAPKLHSVSAGLTELRVFDLPAGYVLSRGDMLSFAFASDPTRYALHRIVTGGTADGAGLSPLLEVEPTVRVGFAVNAAVELRRPFCLAVIRQASPGAGGPVLTSGLGFDWVQVP